jgi:hypothetical protein
VWRSNGGRYAVRRGRRRACRESEAWGVYQGSGIPGHCAAPKGLSCTLVFRVSGDGRTMSFVSKRDVIGAWGCHGGGGEAILGTKKNPYGPGTPVPLLRIHANGTFRGSARFGPTGKQGTVVATGGFTGSGRTASIKFTLDPGPHSCVNGPLKLTAH